MKEYLVAVVVAVVLSVALWCVLAWHAGHVAAIAATGRVFTDAEVAQFTVTGFLHQWLIGVVALIFAGSLLFAAWTRMKEHRG